MIKRINDGLEKQTENQSKNRERLQRIKKPCYSGHSEYSPGCAPLRTAAAAVTAMTISATVGKLAARALTGPWTAR
jgi:hypothetical protein